MSDPEAEGDVNTLKPNEKDDSNENQANADEKGEPAENQSDPAKANPPLDEATSKLKDDITNAIDKIANSIDNSEEQASDKENENLSDCLSAPLASVISKIQVDDTQDDNEGNSEGNNEANDEENDDEGNLSKITFGMTEAITAKPISPPPEKSGENDENESNYDNNNESNNNDTYSEGNESQRKSTKRSRRKAAEEDEEIVQYSDEQLNEAYEEFKKRKQLPPYLMRDAVLDYARRQSLQFMVDENYDAAYKNDLSVNDLLLEYSKDSGGYNTETITRNLEARIEMAQQQRQKSNEKYQSRIQMMKEYEQQKLHQLEDLQEEERKQFEASCQKPEFLQKFSKPSTKLLQIRKIQKSLALAHKFEEAKDVKSEADQMQKAETVQAQRRAIEYIRSSYAQLLEKHQQQLECATENGKRKIRALEEQLNRENLANRNLIRQLELRLKETKTKKGSCLPPLNSSGCKKPPSKSAMKQLAKYRHTQQITMLEVKLTNIQKIVGNVKPATKPVKIM
ncbi:hypothetical protein TRFO_12838 [Tritrichomonas foetus]|uniref:Uncharacterized protein n=1 Tax=Tritrichomonas foetus TaxID=1144522 RepID=A0A1J4L0F1_9EUKA|nr:hypothetical protein TRFO_12838 [Tritrichomonas foetus]|eukprot:OHT16947.1 hypothetical protein TRFO_12838 [Tritrichomonas foetus]